MSKKLKFKELAQRINAHMERMERDPRINNADGKTCAFEARAIRAILATAETKRKPTWLGSTQAITENHRSARK